jgi:hypothetical protein
VREESNLNPGFRERVLSFEIVVVTCLSVAFLGVALYAWHFPAAVGGGTGLVFFSGLFIGWTIFAILAAAWNYGYYRRMTPDRIRLDRDKVVGIYSRRLFGLRKDESRWIEFSAAMHFKDARGRFVGGRYPSEVWAEPMHTSGFNPGSVRELLRGPRSPPGRIRYFFVTDENLRLIRSAWMAWNSQRPTEPE